MMNLLINNRNALIIASILMMLIIAILLPIARRTAFDCVFDLLFFALLHKLNIIELGKEKAERNFIYIIILIDIFFVIFLLIDLLK